MGIRTSSTIRVLKNSHQVNKFKMEPIPHKFNYRELMGYPIAEITPDMNLYKMLLESFVTIPTQYVLSNLNPQGFFQHVYLNEFLDDEENHYGFQIAHTENLADEKSEPSMSVIIVKKKPGGFTYPDHLMERSFRRNGEIHERRPGTPEGEELLGRYLSYISAHSRGLI